MTSVRFWLGRINVGPGIETGRFLLNMTKRLVELFNCSISVIMTFPIGIIGAKRFVIKTRRRSIATRERDMEVL